MKYNQIDQMLEGEKMKTSEAIKAAIKSAKRTQRDVAKMLGMSSYSALSDKIKRENVSVLAVSTILRAVGYEIVFRPKDEASGLPTYVIGDDT